jgi:hypothetical protein
MSCAVGATEHAPIDFFTMTDDCAATVLASGCEPVNGAFKAVKCVLGAVHSSDDKCLVVVVSADLALRHVASISSLNTSEVVISTVGLTKRCCAFVLSFGCSTAAEEHVSQRDVRSGNPYGVVSHRPSTLPSGSLK